MIAVQKLHVVVCVARVCVAQSCSECRRAGCLQWPMPVQYVHLVCNLFQPDGPHLVVVHLAGAHCHNNCDLLLCFARSGVVAVSCGLLLPWALAWLVARRQ